MPHVQPAIHRKTPKCGTDEKSDHSRGRKSRSAPIFARKTGASAPGYNNRYATAFTLVEVLITVGIIVLLSGLVLAGVLAAKKHATTIRIQSDLALIGTALEAYKGDFNGQYPVFADPQTDYNSTSIQGNGQWLDYKTYRGAVLLCRALIGPGPAALNPSNSYASPGDDGADGSGFRTRRNVNSNTGQLSGQVYGPYVDAGKFKIGTTLGTNYPVMLDILGNPILYYPAAPGNPPAILGYSDPSQWNSGSGNVTSRFNGYDNEYFIDAMNATTPPFQTLAANCGTQPYLLWSAGIDGIFGLDSKGKCDDIANFTLAK